MNKMYTLRYCPICRNVKSALSIVNNRVPLENRVDIIDIFSRDPSTCIMETMNEGNLNPMQWRAPSIVVDKPIVKRIFNSHIKSRGERITVQPSTLPFESMLNIMTNLQSGGF